ncbi:MAG: hypothetical protein ACT4P6_15530, partial [Gemmatimonadaceae bacterium]
DNRPPRLQRGFMRVSYRVLPLLTTMLFTGCAPLALRRPATPPGEREVAIIEVANKNFEDLVIYWRKAEIDIPLGVVPGMTSRRFFANPAMLGDGLGAQLSAGLRGQRAIQVSSHFDAGPRARVSWVVDYKLGTSAVVVTRAR